MFRIINITTTLGITKSGTNNTKSTTKVLHIIELAVSVQEAVQTSKKPIEHFAKESRLM